MEDKYRRRSLSSLMMTSSDEVVAQEESQNESGPPDSPPYRDAKVASTSTSSPKRSGKRGAHKRVVSIPIKDVEGFRLKGENAPPPADSWAWRKYGQKPIKGSPYPRGYYRCSSSKGCPARKQVERSRVDPTMLVITYSSDHNHPWPPPSRIHHHHSKPAAATPPDTPPTHPDTPEPEPEPELEPEPANERFTNFGNDEPILPAEEFAWFGEMETTSSSSSTIMDCPMFEGKGTDVGMSDMFLPMREEDELLFADLGELPECTAVFRHHRRGLGTEVEIC